MSRVKIKRHLAKTISYRLLGTIVTMIMAYVLTKEMMISISFGGAEAAIKMMMYFAHERVWYKFIKYGVNGKSNSD